MADSEADATWFADVLEPTLAAEGFARDGASSAFSRQAGLAGELHVVTFEVREELVGRAVWVRIGRTRDDASGRTGNSLAIGVFLTGHDEHQRRWAELQNAMIARARREARPDAIEVPARWRREPGGRASRGRGRPFHYFRQEEMASWAEFLRAVFPDALAEAAHWHLENGRLYPPGSGPPTAEEREQMIAQRAHAVVVESLERLPVGTTIEWAERLPDGTTRMQRRQRGEGSN